MEAMAPARDPALVLRPPALLREPLFWAAAAAFVGSAVGMSGTFLWAAWPGPLGAFGSRVQPFPWLISWAGPSGGLLATLSLLGVASLLGRSSWAARVGVVLLAAWLFASASFLVYNTLRPEDVDPYGRPPLAYLLALRGSFWFGSAAVLPFALGVLFGLRKGRLGAVLLALSVPGLLLVFFLARSYASASLSTITTLVGPLSFPGAGLGVPETALWVALGVLLLGSARERALDKAELLEASENRKRAELLYEKGLGRGDLSVVGDLVSGSFRDLRSGSRGRLGMERVLSDLRRSFPDLTVRLEGQDAEADLVKTRLLLSGTDRGGVLWYPPTGRRAAFRAEFVDRFSGGRLVEHGGETDTEGLLRQLGLPDRGGTPGWAGPATPTARRKRYAPPPEERTAERASDSL